MYEFQRLTSTVSVFLWTSLWFTALAEGNVREKSAGRCEVIRVPMCQDDDINYNRTFIPNLLNQHNQDGIGLEVNQFAPLIKIQCSQSTRLFLCSVYLPRCINSTQPVAPCRSLCERVKEECNSTLVKFGFQWPDQLRCDRFPSTNERCVSESGHIITPHKDNSPKNYTCEPIRIPMCNSGLAYNATILPNFLNQTDQDDIALEISSFYPLIKVQCSPVFKQLLCAVYVPMCSETSLNPCRTMCEQVRRGCGTLMDKFGFPWPKSLDCERFPLFGECLGPNGPINITDQNIDNSNTTGLPNGDMSNSTNQHLSSEYVTEPVSTVKQGTGDSSVTIDNVTETTPTTLAHRSSSKRLAFVTGTDTKFANHGVTGVYFPSLDGINGTQHIIDNTVSMTTEDVGEVTARDTGVVSSSESLRPEDFVSAHVAITAVFHIFVITLNCIDP